MCDAPQRLLMRRRATREPRAGGAVAGPGRHAPPPCAPPAGSPPGAHAPWRNSPRRAAEHLTGAARAPDRRSVRMAMMKHMAAAVLYAVVGLLSPSDVDSLAGDADSGDDDARPQFVAYATEPGRRD